MKTPNSSTDHNIPPAAFKPASPPEPIAFEDQRIAAARKRDWGSRTLVNLLVDAALMVLVIMLLFSAAVLRFVFPAPSTAAGWTLWGQSYDTWSAMQFVLTSILGLSILLHVMLHWSWVCGAVLSKVLRRRGRLARLDDGQQTLWGVGMLIFVVNLLGLLIGLAYLTIQPPPL